MDSTFHIWKGSYLTKYYRIHLVEYEACKVFADNYPDTDVVLRPCIVIAEAGGRDIIVPKIEIFENPPIETDNDVDILLRAIAKWIDEDMEIWLKEHRFEPVDI